MPEKESSWEGRRPGPVAAGVRTRPGTRVQLTRCCRCINPQRGCAVLSAHDPRTGIFLRSQRDADRLRHDDVLRSRAIWTCTGCYACTVECPKQLPVTELIYALKRASMRAGVYPRRFVTPVRRRQFVRLVGKRGSSEAWISLSLYLRTRPFQVRQMCWWRCA